MQERGCAWLRDGRLCEAMCLVSSAVVSKYDESEVSAIYKISPSTSCSDMTCRF
jgi:hypothetical protein